METVLAVIGALITLISMYRFLFLAPEEERAPTEWTETGATDFGADSYLTTVFGPGTPSLGPPPPPASLEPADGIIEHVPETPPWEQEA